MTGDPSETIDAFHRGAFHIVQPNGRGHRSGMDAMLLAALVVDERAIRVADLGAGAGAAGMAVASRLDQADREDHIRELQHYLEPGSWLSPVARAIANAEHEETAVDVDRMIREEGIDR